MYMDITNVTALHKHSLSFCYNLPIFQINPRLIHSPKVNQIPIFAAKY